MNQNLKLLISESEIADPGKQNINPKFLHHKLHLSSKPFRQIFN
ncbi:hypothetical protein [[Phormidium] sp. LEGE 05292]|nr:hypothetical protein [Phormidium sp. LEGE 05292]